ncbi:MAG: DUF4430 domain-containing protein [Firmicutes bacterium]|nr:DUF4430 domain-containing protein [Bacillota bacterium]
MRVNKKTKALSLKKLLLALFVASAVVFTAFTLTGCAENRFDVEETGQFAQLTISYYTTDTSGEWDTTYFKFTLRVSVVEGDVSTYYVIKQDSPYYLIDILNYIAYQTDFTFEYTDYAWGAFITTIYGLEADSSSYFWQILVNGRSSVWGASALQVHYGSVYRIQLATF